MSFYHFTDKANIPSIKKHGLLSWEYLVQHNIDHVPGSNGVSRRLDKDRNLENYVRLCYNKTVPMYYIAILEKRIKDPIWLEIDESVKDLAGSIYSTHNATDGASIQVYISQLHEFEDFIVRPKESNFYKNYIIVNSQSSKNLFYFDKNQENKFGKYFGDRQREVLIKEKIDPKFITFTQT